MNAESRELQAIPQSLQGILENPTPPDEREAVSTSVECGTVEDIRITVTAEGFENLRHYIDGLKDRAIEAKKAAGQAKWPAQSIELIPTNQPFAKITTLDGHTVQVFYTNETKTQGFGGGAFNTTTDAALIGQTLHEALGVEESQIPKTRLFLTLQPYRHGDMRRMCAPLKSLDLNLITGTPRRSIFIKHPDTDEELYFSTALGSIDEDAEINRIPTPRHLILHNQPDPQALNDVRDNLRQSQGDTHLTWSLGSNQITDGIDRYQNMLPMCNAFTCNLPEAITWIRSSRDPLISQDPTLIAHLEESPELPKNQEQLDRLISVITKLAVKAKLAIHAFLEADNKTIQYQEVINYLLQLPAGTLSEHDFKELNDARRNYVPPSNPEKRQVVAQRVAHLLSRMMADNHYIFLTDGSHPTTIVRTKRNPDTNEKQTNFHYVPVLRADKRERIEAAIKARGALPATKDATGCGDCYTATVVALRQAAGPNIHATTIATLANHYTYLVYCLGYSNLLEIERAYPGLVKAVTDICLEDLDERSLSHHENSRLNPVSPAKQRTTSAISRLLANAP